MRALYEVIGKDRQLEIPWSSLFGGEPLTGRQLESPADKPR
jgi:hypothetical protein